MEILFFGVMGWCGTKYPGWWRGPKRPQPEPWRPQPQPWAYAVLTVIGITIGTISGLIFNDIIGNQSVFVGQELIASGLLSFATSNIVTGLVSPMMKERKEI